MNIIMFTTIITTLLYLLVGGIIIKISRENKDNINNTLFTITEINIFFVVFHLHLCLITEFIFQKEPLANEIFMHDSHRGLMIAITLITTSMLIYVGYKKFKVLE